MLIDGSCLFSYECKTCPGNWNNDTNVVNIGDCSYIIAFKYIDCYCPSDTCRREMQINSFRSLVPACNTVNSDSLMNFSVRRLLQIAHSVFGVPDPGVSEYKITISNPSCFYRNMDTLLPCLTANCCGRDYTMILEDGEPIVKEIDPDSVAPYNCFGLIGGPCGTHLCSSQMVPLNLPLFYVREDCDHDNCYWRLDGNYLTGNNNMLGSLDDRDIRFITNNNERMLITRDGDISIGNIYPIGRFDVKLRETGKSRIIFSSSTSTNANLRFYSAVGSAMYPWWISSNLYFFKIKSAESTVTNPGDEIGSLIDILTINNSSSNKYIYIHENYPLGLGITAGINQQLAVKGKVRIGMEEVDVNSDYYDSYFLSVDGDIVAKQIIVSVESDDRMDNVFAKDYQLMTINQVDNFIKTHGHLPEIPTNSEVSQKGLNLGEMDAKLLKKIEELTLYIIELKKEVELLKTNQVNQANQKK